MTFSRTALLAVGIAMVAGVAYGIWQLRTDAPLQANVAETVAPAAEAATIPGTWQSADDASYRVVFGEDGTVAEEYDGNVVSQGTYHFASSPEGYLMTDAAPETGGPRDYLLEDLEGERYAYRVLSLTSTTLELGYLERGNTLTFTR